MTAGIFVSICTWASHQREENKIPYWHWRILKINRELNPKYPGGIAEQTKMLNVEGHEIIKKGRKNIRFFVKKYEASLIDLYDIL